jgi:hypothetical protein
VRAGVDTRLTAVPTIEQALPLWSAVEVYLLSNLHIQYRQVTQVEELFNLRSVGVVLS